MFDTNFSLGIYEKALPQNISWRDKLLITKKLGFDFIEISIDETEHRLDRLNWDRKTCSDIQSAMLETDIHIKTMCLSGHRKFPFGSTDKNIRDNAFLIMEKAINLAIKLGIRTIQLAGYDVYYEPHSATTTKLFEEGLIWATKLASKNHIMLAIETMDTPFFTSISTYKYWQKKINSPWLKIYPDIGNLSAWQLDVENELEIGISDIVGIHLKDTKMVTASSKGSFKNVNFGDGCVDFINIFRKLKKLDYNGSFLIEMWSEESEDPILEITKARQWIIDKMKQANIL